jgi:hypothetical protein
MCRTIRTLTGICFVLPVVFVAMGAWAGSLLAIPGALIAGIYAWIWLRFRPTHFTVRPDAIEVVWPLKRRTIPRADISSVRLLDKHGIKQETGWALRVGAGGLWGGFGWLWTQRRGIVQMYISRLDGFVWIDRVGGRPWLITPDRPEIFIRALLE